MTTKLAVARAEKGTLAKYDPHRATKEIDFLEAVEKHYVKAKDATKFEQALR